MNETTQTEVTSDGAGGVLTAPQPTEPSTQPPVGHVTEFRDIGRPGVSSVRIQSLESLTGDPTVVIVTEAGEVHTTLRALIDRFMQEAEPTTPPDLGTTTTPVETAIVEEPEAQSRGDDIKTAGVAYFNSSKVRALADGPLLFTTTSEGMTLTSPLACLFIPAASPARTVVSIENEKPANGSADRVIDLALTSASMNLGAISSVLGKAAFSVKATRTAVPEIQELKESMNV